VVLSVAGSGLLAAVLLTPQAFAGTLGGGGLFGRAGASRGPAGGAGFTGEQSNGIAGGLGGLRQRGNGACTDVHIIATRASTERQGAGIIGSLVTAVSQATEQSVSTDNTVYPAALNPYGPSVAAGVKALSAQISSEVAACPNTKIVLMGYSQGAHVIGDVLAGSGRQALTPVNAALPADQADNISAVILMGDPRYVPNKSFNAGTSKRAGLFARGADAPLDSFADRTQSYCDTGDTFCASGQNIAVHLGYTRKYNTQAEDFVLSRIGG
jgi:hypothetical protein